jgi:hypothetical protein
MRAGEKVEKQLAMSAGRVDNAEPENNCVALLSRIHGKSR